MRRREDDDDDDGSSDDESTPAQRGGATAISDGMLQPPSMADVTRIPRITLEASSAYPNQKMAGAAVAVEPLRRKVSWHTSVLSSPSNSSTTKEQRRHQRTATPGPVRRFCSLKQMAGVQRSASLESVSAVSFLPSDLSAACGSLTTPAAACVPNDDDSRAATSDRDHQQQQYSSVVEELRRSSELLRNILLGLSSSGVRSESSDRDGESKNDSITRDGGGGNPTSEPQLGAPGKAQRVTYANDKLISSTTTTTSNLMEVVPDLQAALQSHRKRRWFSLTEPMPKSSSPSPTSGEATATLVADAIGVRLDRAAQASQQVLLQAIASGHVNRVRQLLESGSVDPKRPVTTADGGGHCHYSDLLHWCTAQTPTPWPSILLLLEHGCRRPCFASSKRKTKAGGSDQLLVASDDTFSRIQQQLVSDAFAYLIIHYSGNGSGSGSGKGAIVLLGSSTDQGSCIGGSTTSTTTSAALQSTAPMNSQPHQTLQSQQSSDALLSAVSVDYGGGGGSSSQLHVSGSGRGGGILQMPTDTFASSTNASLQQQQRNVSASGNLFRRLHQSAVAGRNTKQPTTLLLPASGGQSTITSSSSTGGVTAGGASITTTTAAAVGTLPASTTTTISQTPTHSSSSQQAATLISSSSSSSTYSKGDGTCSVPTAHVNKFKDLQHDFSFDSDASSGRVPPVVEITSIKVSKSFVCSFIHKFVIFLNVN